MSMELRIIQVENREQWDGWLINSYDHTSFAQSWEWGGILAKENKIVERLAVIDGEKILAQAQVIYTPLPFGWKYAFCPKGPIVNRQFSLLNFQSVYNALSEYLKSKGCIFFRIEPRRVSSISLSSGSSKKTKKVIDINPPATLLLDLTQTEDQILQMMHPKTRYNIRLAQKKDVIAKNIKDWGTFWRLMKTTGGRGNFRLHSESHYRNIFESPFTHQIVSYYNEVPLATAIFIHLGNTLTYLYGASDNRDRNVMASYLLQWEAARLGKSVGCKYYDFFGVAPRKHLMSDQDGLIMNEAYFYDPNHQYAGVTRFKLGFGGLPHEDPGTWDLIIDKKKYRIYEVMRKIRRLI